MYGNLISIAISFYAPFLIENLNVENNKALFVCFFLRITRVIKFLRLEKNNIRMASEIPTHMLNRLLSFAIKLA